MAQVAPGESANITKLGTSSSTIRVQTEKLNEAQSDELRTELAQQFGVDRNQVSASFIGPSWGQSVSQQALRALVVFLVLTFIVMALYFRTWKMSVAAMAALVHDMVITVGIYAWTGFEVSPATMIGFLTVLGYSLYDTVVVFDKVRENTEEAFGNRRSTYAEAANLAVNQTVVRSINTTVVALLPIAAVLVMGFTVIGPGTLLDLSLVLFIGMAVGAYSSIFIATPLLATMRAKPRVIDLDRAAGKFHAREAKDARRAAGQEAPRPQCRVAPTARRPRSASPRSSARASARAVVAPRPARSTRTPRPAPQPAQADAEVPPLRSAMTDAMTDTSTAEPSVPLAELVASRLRDIPDFPEPGVVFKDVTPLLADGPAFSAVVRDIADRRRGTVDLVAGIEARGFIFGAAVAHENRHRVRPGPQGGQAPRQDQGRLLRPRVRQRHHRDPRGLVRRRRAGARDRRRPRHRWHRGRDLRAARGGERRGRGHRDGRRAGFPPRALPARGP